MLQPKEIPSFVGREEFARALGISTKTLQRMVNDGGFPRPTRLSPNRVGWSVSIVRTHLESRIQGVTQLAVTDPAKLKPDDVADALQQLGARHASALAGRPIAPEDIVGLTVKLTDEQRQAVADAATDQLQAAGDTITAALATLDPVRAWLVVAGLLPTLRPAADKFLQTITGVAPKETPAQMRALAVDIVDQALSGEFVGPGVADNGSGAAGAATMDGKG